MATELDPDPKTPLGALSAAIFALNTLQYPDGSAPTDVLRLAAMTDDAIATLVQMRDRLPGPVSTTASIVVFECALEANRTMENDTEASTQDVAADIAQRLYSVYGVKATTEDTWPETDAERIAFVDWQYEVGNGDTILGFRPWMTHRTEEGA